jgi:pilus assembly protein TadC
MWLVLSIRTIANEYFKNRLSSLAVALFCRLSVQIMQSGSEVACVGNVLSKKN